jgi:adenine phosphoribosyltransferase
MMDLKKIIRDVPDFPKKGIIFKDITTLLKDRDAFRYAIDKMIERYKGEDISLIVGIESRGFIFGPLLAYHLNAGFIPVRKPGKLPSDTVTESYDLEYGKDAVEIHKDAINPGDKVLIVDDLLATGGTSYATAKMIEKCEGTVVGFAFLIELGFLKGRDKIKDYNIFSLISY